ncbi:alpha/beta fold hydrolase [Niveispirillum fermenti]|uniref:alpha/beta fold hydrolase n=1 Tax=Niveispirillum fermenti TaxID=1233113 RepID=UPI003A838BBE
MVMVRRAYVDGRFGQMHLRIAREGGGGRPPLLCIHMSPMSGRVFEDFLGEMGADRTAIAFDTPGFGLSDPPPSPPSIADYAGALLDGLSALGIEGPVDVMGYHTGSMIAVEMARQAPSRIRRLVMVAAPVITAQEREQFRAFYREKPVQADGSHLLARWQGFHYYHMRPGADLEAIAEKFPDALLGGAKSAWGHQAAFAYDLAGRMAGLDQPALVLVTGDDLDVQTRRADGLARTARLIEVPGWGHGFLDMHTADAALMVRAFLDAAAGDPFAGIVPPLSALGPRYPAHVGAFRPVPAD